MNKNETLAYFAGIIDGEGYIGIKKQLPTTNSGGKSKRRGKAINPCYYERISVAGTDKCMINRIVETFKVGKVYFHKHSKLSKRGYWSWDVTNKLAVSVIEQVYPYLRVKKPEADLVIKLRKSKNTVYRTLPPGIVAEREKLYQSIKDLHTFD